MSPTFAFRRAAAGCTSGLCAAALFLCASTGALAEARAPSAAKRAAVQSVDQHSKELIALSDEIWGYAEIALREHK